MIKMTSELQLILNKCALPEVKRQKIIICRNNWDLKHICFFKLAWSEKERGNKNFFWIPTNLIENKYRVEHNIYIYSVSF